jgi:hypothetical protein
MKRMFNFTCKLGTEMKGRLTSIQVDYVLDHIAHHAEVDDKLRQLINYGVKPVPGLTSIYFPASEAAVDLDKVIRIDEIPVLYQVDKVSNSFYSFNENSLYFHHDLLKSIFHLLSGYEEVKNGATDQYGRFPYSQSLQFKLGIIDKPVVNYYMDIILRGIRQFCEKNRISFQSTPLLKGPILMLSHDIDFIDAYDFKETAFKFKQLLGLADSPFKMKGKIRDAFSAFYHFLNPFSKKNPFWNFTTLRGWESERGFQSTYFFLEKDGKYDNSRYRFHDKRIRRLIEDLSDAGDEIGIHGTMQSYTSKSAMHRTVEHLREVSPKPVIGIRQHFLKFKPNITAQIQAQLGLRYDASLGFSEHEGFRNSYCWPFKFFDFDKQQAMDYWEIPLTVMDVTLFRNRKLNFDQSRKAIGQLASEVVKFNGVFSLLWHNSFFDEREFPGVTAHYLGMLDHLKTLGMEGVTGREIIEKMETRDPGNS